MNLKQKIVVTAFLSLFLSSIAIGVVIGTNAKKNKELPSTFLNENGNENDTTEYWGTDDSSIPGYEKIEASLTEDQVLTIALNDPTIQEFLDNYPDAETYCYYDGYGYWYVEFFALDWMSYAYVIIEDNTGNILESNVYYYSEESNLTEEQAIAIAETNDEVQNFITANPNYEVYAYYDYYQYWYVDFYDEYFFSWISVTLDDTTGEIIDVYSFEEIYNTSLTSQEVVDIAFTDLDVQEFISNNPEYEVYVYLMDYFYCGNNFDNMSIPETGEDDANIGEIGFLDNYTLNLTWVVEFYNANYTDWIILYIDDATGEIIEKWMTKPAIHTEKEIEEIVLALPEVQEFLNNVNDTQLYVWYDGYGYWYINIYSEISWEAYLYATIDDITGEVIDLYYYIPEPPLHTEEEVETFVLSLDEVQDFIRDHPDYEMWISFSYGYWYVEFYSSTSYESLWIEIIDDNGNGDLEIIYLEYYQYEIIY